MAKLRHAWKSTNADKEEAVAQCQRCGLFRLIERRPVYDAWGKRIFNRYRFDGQVWSQNNVPCREPNQEELFGDRSPLERDLISSEYRMESAELEKRFPWVPKDVFDNSMLRETLRIFRNAEIVQVRMPKKKKEDS